MRPSTSDGAASSHPSDQSTSRWNGWWSMPIVTSTRRLPALEEPANDLSLPVEALLAFPLQEKQIAQRITEPSRERGGVDAVVDLDVHSANPVQLGRHEERECHARAGGHDDVGARPANRAPREAEVPDRVGDVPR